MPTFGHDLCGHGVNAAGLQAGAIDMDSLTAQVVQPAMGHLGAGAVAGANYEDVEACGVVGIRIHGIIGFSGLGLCTTGTNLVSLFV